MTSRSRKHNIKSNRKNERREVASAADGRTLPSAICNLSSQRWLIGAVAALTSATLLLNSDCVTFEGDNILVALIWSLLAALFLFVRWYRNKPFSFDACDNGA
ncbi:MAG: hypothetical protein FWD31_12860, partial [Planctomycetaceae bacterium]|nr:hypothetical protein [Planctomycetaceae bacterium]